MNLERVRVWRSSQWVKVCLPSLNSELKERSRCLTFEGIEVVNDVILARVSLVTNGGI